MSWGRGWLAPFRVNKYECRAWAQRGLDSYLRNDMCIDVFHRRPSSTIDNSTSLFSLHHQPTEHIYFSATTKPCPCIHSVTRPLTSSGLSQSNQCEALTSLAVNSGTLGPILPTSSSVTIVSPRALTNKVGHLILMPSSISSKGLSASKFALRLR
jgi:hypothetical protein